MILAQDRVGPGLTATAGLQTIGAGQLTERLTRFLAFRQHLDADLIATHVAQGMMLDEMPGRALVVLQQLGIAETGGQAESGDCRKSETAEPDRFPPRITARPESC